MKIILLRRMAPLAVCLAALAGMTVHVRAAEPQSTACQLARPYQFGVSERSLESGGRRRRFSLYVPRSYSGKNAVPVVLDLHASGITPDVELKVTGIAEAAEKEGFVVALPAGVTDYPHGGTTWNIPRDDAGVDDVTFIAEMLNRITKVLCIDTSRVYAMGFSGGARFASELGCQMPDRFAAVGVVGGLRYPAGEEGECNSNGRAVSVIAFHSTDDPVNPYEDDGERNPGYWTYGVEEALRRWVDRSGCAGQPVRKQISPEVARIVYHCTGAEIVFYRLSGTGHTWPGSAFTFPKRLGATEDGIDATALILQFFKRHELRHE